MLLGICRKHIHTYRCIYIYTYIYAASTYGLLGGAFSGGPSRPESIAPASVLAPAPHIELPMLKTSQVFMRRAPLRKVQLYTRHYLRVLWLANLLLSTDSHS